MASICLNLLPSPQPPFQQFRKPTEILPCSSSLSSSYVVDGRTSRGIRGLKPIVVTGNPATFVSAPGRRIVAVGDLHGDLEQARLAFQIAGVLSSDGRDVWVGKETVLVQLGDILDRGDNEIAILSLLRSLDAQARAEGGAVFQVNGNHETMNVEGDFRYVDAGAFDECLEFLDYLEDHRYEWDQAFVGWIRFTEQQKKDREPPPNSWSPWNLVKVVNNARVSLSAFGQKQKGVIARSALFRPGGALACELSRHPVVLKVNDWIFCHGGLLPHHVDYGIERLNWEVSQWMRGLSEEDEDPQIPFIATRGYDSIVWNRMYSRDLSDLDGYRTKQIQSVLQETLSSLGAKAMVVGHTPQLSGVNCKYDCSIWRVDVGMSSGVLNSRPEVLEIVDGKARVIRSGRDMTAALEVADYT